ncbi:hypothetical protein NMY22_g15733 [Coprinellus aureogranulatus]|nr:hypothetical protein NMY22_g15733 [Coprinellus aureogranulatus]
MDGFLGELVLRDARQRWGNAQVLKSPTYPSYPSPGAISALQRGHRSDSPPKRPPVSTSSRAATLSPSPPISTTTACHTRYSPSPPISTTTRAIPPPPSSDVHHAKHQPHSPLSPGANQYPACPPPLQNSGLLPYP